MALGGHVIAFIVVEVSKCTRGLERSSRGNKLQQPGLLITLQPGKGSDLTIGETESLEIGRSEMGNKRRV